MHQNAQSLHLTPVSLVPVVYNMVGQHVSRVDKYANHTLIATVYSKHKVAGSVDILARLHRLRRVVGADGVHRGTVVDLSACLNVLSRVRSHG